MSSARALGCFYGQAIGDALGSRYEFRMADEVCRMIAADRDPLTGVLPLLGSVSLDLHPGQVTDVTELAMSLVRSLVRLDHYDNADVACSYVRWRTSNPPDVSNTILQVLNIDKRFESTISNAHWYMYISDDDKKCIEQTVLDNARKYNSMNLSNVCLMRISPMAIAATRIKKYSIDDIRRMASDNCALTNPNPIAIDAVRVYVLAIRSLLLGDDPQTCYQSALQSSENAEVRALLQEAADRPIPVRVLDSSLPVNGDWTGQVYLGVALQSAFYELLHAKSFIHAVVGAVERGGDTNTNGAIVGAMMGARFGIDEIPIEWLNAVRDGQRRSHAYDEVRLDDGDEIVKQLIA